VTLPEAQAVPVTSPPEMVVVSEPGTKKLIPLVASSSV